MKKLTDLLLKKTQPSRTALVLIEFQKQWTSPGLYNRLIRSQLACQQAVANGIELANWCRKQDIAVIHAPLILDPQHKRGWLAYLTGAKFFTKNTDKAEFTPGIYKKGDMVATGRYAFDAFVGSNLESLLRKNGYDTVIFAGFVTDQCVSKTFVTARKKGFRSFIAPQATATFSKFIQRRIEKKYADYLISSP